MSTTALTALAPGTQVCVTAPGPWRGRIGIVTSAATRGSSTRVLVAGLDATMPRLSYVFGAQELQALPEMGIEVPHA